MSILYDYYRDGLSSLPFDSEEDLSTEIARMLALETQIDIVNEIEQIESDIKEAAEGFDHELSAGDDIYQDLYQASLSTSVSGLFIQYITLLSSLAEQFTGLLIKRELIQEEFRESGKTDNLIYYSMSQADRENLLLRTGVIDESTKSELAHLRSVRNSFIHNQVEMLLMNSIENIETESKRLFDSINELSTQIIGDDVVTVQVSPGSQD